MENKSPISSKIVAQIVYEENISTLSKILIDELDFSLVEIVEKGKNGYKGMVFTRKLNGEKVDLYVSFFLQEYGCRDVQIRTKDKNTFVFMNKELLAYANPSERRNDGQMEYETGSYSSGNKLFMRFVDFTSGELCASIKSDSHFAIMDQFNFKDEIIEVKRTFGEGRKFLKFFGH